MADLFSVSGPNATVTWEAEPATRGTYTLLSTCVITLTLCVWSSVHLNLPGNNRDCCSKFSRRLGWIICGLLAPEYLILTAWSQRQTAKRIFKEIEVIFPNSCIGKDDPEHQVLPRQHPWTMTHSFWAVMGGIAVDVGNSETFVSRRCTLTAEGISLLLKHEPQLLPDISVEEVKDKSKGGAFSKFRACIQATWFCLSCIARISENLPISMLELNTFAHALCTVIVYVIWWRKPLDIDQPLLINDNRIRPLLAYMWMSSSTSCISKPKNTGNYSYTVGQDPEFEALLDDPASPASADPVRDVPIHTRTEPTTATKPGVVKVTATQNHPSTGFRVNKSSTRWVVHETYSPGDGGKVYSNTYRNAAVFDLTPSDVQRWELAREAMDRYRLEKPDTDLDLVNIRSIPEHMSYGEHPTAATGFWAFLGFAFVAAGYGGMHALAWNAQFPSSREQLLWRISALAIASPAVLSMVAVALWWLPLWFYVKVRLCLAKFSLVSRPEQHFQPKMLNVKENLVPKSNPRLEIALLPILKTLGFLAQVTMLVAFICVYLPARGFLVYESFRAVFYLPPKAYKATSWPQYLPHIT
jgi:hypothetical protein